MICPLPGYFCRKEISAEGHIFFSTQARPSVNEPSNFGYILNIDNTHDISSDTYRAYSVSKFHVGQIDVGLLKAKQSLS